MNEHQPVGRQASGDSPGAAARVELTALRATWEYAFAHGAACYGGTHRPEYVAVLGRERDLLAIVKEHRA